MVEIIIIAAGVLSFFAASLFLLRQPATIDSNPFSNNAYH
jgi:hypothetical protein